MRDILHAFAYGAVVVSIASAQPAPLVAALLLGSLVGAGIWLSARGGYYQGQTAAHREHLRALDRLEADLRSLPPPCTCKRRVLYAVPPPRRLQ